MNTDTLLLKFNKIIQTATLSADKGLALEHHDRTATAIETDAVFASMGRKNLCCFVLSQSWGNIIDISSGRNKNRNISGFSIGANGCSLGNSGISTAILWYPIQN